jgi:hypothetical protein
LVTVGDRRTAVDRAAIAAAAAPAATATAAGSLPEPQPKRLGALALAPRRALLARLRGQARHVRSATPAAAVAIVMVDLVR